MESTIEKLNQNRLMELTEQDYENIANNTELKTLFMSKVKEGHQFNFEDASNVFDEEDLETDDGITYYDLEFDVGENEYDYEINAYTGAIIDFDHDIDD